MSLTRGGGPLSPNPTGVFNFRPHGDNLLYLEPSPRWIRGELARETVVDSRGAMLLHESGRLPVYYFPGRDVASRLLARSEHTTHSPLKGVAVHWSIRVGGCVAENAAWSYPEPVAGAQALAGLIAFEWSALDRWLEESEEATGNHPRDPYHRVDVLKSSRHVRVSFDGHELAETTRAKVLFETGHPPRWYIPIEDVRQEVLVPIDLETACAYKGKARYRSVRLGERLENALAWWYPRPRPEAAAVGDHLCFFNERVDLVIDGELLARPRTPWMSDSWIRRAQG